MTVAAETGAELTSLPIESKSLGETARLRRRAVAGPVGQRVRRHAICLQVMKRSVTRLPGGSCPGQYNLRSAEKPPHGYRPTEQSRGLEADSSPRSCCP